MFRSYEYTTCDCVHNVFFIEIQHILVLEEILFHKTLRREFFTCLLLFYLDRLNEV
jgi:hypothetical protein